MLTQDKTWHRLNRVKSTSFNNLDIWKAFKDLKKNAVDFFLHHIIAVHERHILGRMQNFIKHLLFWEAVPVISHTSAGCVANIFTDWRGCMAWLSLVRLSQGKGDMVNCQWWQMLFHYRSYNEFSLSPPLSLSSYSFLSPPVLQIQLAAWPSAMNGC